MQIEELMGILKKIGKGPVKKLGQNFLLDEEVIEQMLQVARVGKNDIVLEIGPGLGFLTQGLVEKALRVVVVEKDEGLKSFLTETFKAFKNLEIIFGDFLRIDLQGLNLNKYKVVANLPYYITAPIINKLVGGQNRPESLTMLVQKEVGENLTRNTGVSNLLDLAVKLNGRCEFVTLVPARSFYPKPKVDSAVVHVEVYKESLVNVEDQALVFKVAKALFLGKRKQIHNTLQNNLLLPKESVLKVLKEVGLQGTERPEHLSVQNYIDLAQSWERNK